MSTGQHLKTAKSSTAKGLAQKGGSPAEPMSLRIDAETRSLIDRAANVLGQSRTDFMLSSARDRATDVLLSQSFFLLEAEDWQRFNDTLDQPPPPNAKLKALLARKPPWTAG
ncbi:MAG: DUF1778 domain-containing protein [Hyphomicrobiaceae bacterium]|nr:DUF1778 domain-containing protein [Hyphomicrobiaceae bacterium]